MRKLLCFLFGHEAPTDDSRWKDTVKCVWCGRMLKPEDFDR